jgi:hypothetical protein
MGAYRLVLGACVGGARWCSHGEVLEDKVQKSAAQRLS